MPRHRRLAHRLLAALLAFLFAGSAMEGAGAHACPMHDGSMVAATLAAAEARSAATAAAHGTHDAHMAHGAAHGAAPAATHEGGGHDEGGHHCTCPDDACSAGIVALASPRLTTHFGIAVADVRLVFAPGTSHRPVRVPHATPFANGPPAAALA